MPAILLVLLVVVGVFLYYRMEVASYSEDTSIVYDNEFEDAYNQIPNDDFEKLEELKKKVKRQVRINNMTVIILFVILFIISILPQTDTFRNIIDLSMAVFVGVFVLFCVIACTIGHFIRKKGKTMVKIIDDKNMEIINRFLVNTRKFGNSIEDSSEIKNTYLREFGNASNIARYDYNVCERTDFLYYDNKYTFSNALVHIDKYEISTVNVQKYKEVYKTRRKVSIASYELFAEVKLNNRIIEENSIQIVKGSNSDIKLQIKNPNTKLASLIKQNLEEKLLKYYKNYYSFEILIKNDRIYIRVAEIVGYKYYLTRLPRKEFFYEICKSRKFILKLANELIDVIENI